MRALPHQKRAIFNRIHAENTTLLGTTITPKCLSDADVADSYAALISLDSLSLVLKLRRWLIFSTVLEAKIKHALRLLSRLRLPVHGN
jgi:hypothetical protein